MHRNETRPVMVDKTGAGNFEHTGEFETVRIEQRAWRVAGKIVVQDADQPAPEDGQEVTEEWLIEQRELDKSKNLVPAVVTRFQARAALHLAGLLPQIESLMADPSTDALARLAWTDAQEFRRQSPTVLSMAATLGLTDAQLDALFTTAAGIEA